MYVFIYTNAIKNILLDFLENWYRLNKVVKYHFSSF